MDAILTNKMNVYKMTIEAILTNKIMIEAILTAKMTTEVILTAKIMTKAPHDGHEQY